MANKRGREREDIRQRQSVWREEREKLLGRERKGLRGREKGRQEGGTERGRKRNEKYIIQFHICSMYFKILLNVFVTCH